MLLDLNSIRSKNCFDSDQLFKCRSLLGSRTSTGSRGTCPSLASNSVGPRSRSERPTWTSAYTASEPRCTSYGSSWNSIQWVFHKHREAVFSNISIKKVTTTVCVCRELPGGWFSRLATRRKWKNWSSCYSHTLLCTDWSCSAQVARYRSAAPKTMFTPPSATNQPIKWPLPMKSLKMRLHVASFYDRFWSIQTMRALKVNSGQTITNQGFRSGCYILYGLNHLKIDYRGEMNNCGSYPDGIIWHRVFHIWE